MQQIGRIGEKSAKIPLRIKILTGLLAFILIFAFLNVRFHSIAVTLGQSEISYFFSSAVTKAMQENLVQKQVEYRDFVTLTFKEGGEVAAMTTDMVRLLTLQNDVCQAVFSSYNSLYTLSLSIPFFWLFGVDFLSFIGPSAKIEILPARFLHTYCTSEFEAAGINQTRHRIVFHAEGNFVLLFPQGKDEITITESYCIAETLIVGKVPDAYTEINRLTDDIIESEIDDIYDFGATIN